MEWFSEDPRFECVKPRRRVLPVPAHHEGARSDGHRQHRRLLADAARRSARGAGGGRRVRRARASCASRTRPRSIGCAKARRGSSSSSRSTSDKAPPLDSGRTLPSGFISRVAGIVGGPFVLQDASSRDTYGTDGTKKGAPPTSCPDDAGVAMANCATTSASPSWQRGRTGTREARAQRPWSRGERAVRRLFQGVVLELSRDEIALMKRVKAAFDPHGILNPGKIFPDE